MRKSRNFYRKKLNIMKKDSCYILAAIKQAARGVVVYDYNAGCCQAKRVDEIFGFVTVYKENKKIFDFNPTKIIYVNKCNDVFKDEFDEKLLDSQSLELYKIIKESKEPVLLCSHLGKILFV